MLMEVSGKSMRYYNFIRHWTKRIEPHLANEELNKVLVKYFHKYTWGRWRRAFLPGMTVEEWESCDWRFEHKAPWPRYWKYVKHGACHWLVNFALKLAMLAEPKREWRIVTSDGHSAVWDGENTLFDLQYSALGVTAEDSWNILKTGVQLKPGEYLKVYLCPYYKTMYKDKANVAS